MKFYRMMNGDIVTGVQLVMGAPALKATKVFDAEKGSYCFTTCLYREGVKERLNTAQKTVLMNQLNKSLSLSGPIHEDSFVAHLPHVTNWEKLREWKGAVKEAIHDYTK